MRVTRVLLPIFAVLAVLAAGCDWPNIAPFGTAPVRYRDPIFTAVTVTSNIKYGSAVNLENTTVTLQLDMYQPTGDKVTARPAIVWVHGGSFCCGTKTSPELVDEATTFSKEGYLNVSIDYRLESPGCSGSLSNCVPAIQEATADAQTAVSFLRTNAVKYGIDPNRIAIGGSSAGAITALNVGYSSSEDPSASVRAAVSLSGAQVAVGTVSAGDAPALDFHCTTDPLVPYSWAVSTINSAKALGLDAFLESWNETCHVPYTEHRQQILDQSRNFLWWEMDLAHAST
ncbi:MAG: alpha/beta hydrolase [Acidimicrobiales bacterium]|jgi:predicted esterase|nr:alpha/beta hydrolase [Acidimicrobiales bacterium]